MKQKIRGSHFTIGIALLLLVTGTFFPSQLSAYYTGLYKPLGTPTATLNLGQVSTGKTTSSAVLLVNSRSTPINISSVYSSCGCTGAKVSNSRIGPFGRSTLSITIHPNRAGPGWESVNLKTSRGDQEVKINFHAVD